MPVVGELSVLISASTKKLRDGLRRGREAINRFADKMSGLTSIARKVGKGVAVGLAGTITAGVALAAQAEKTEAQLQVMLKSATKASMVLKDLRKVADDTRLPDAEVKAAGKQLVGYGLATGKLVSTMNQLAEASAGSGAKLNDLAEIYGRIRQGGIAMNEDLERLNDRGISITATIAQMTGRSVPEVRKLASESKITFEVFERAFRSLTTGSGIFAGSVARIGDTLLGKLQELRKEATRLTLEIGQGFLEGLTGKKVRGGIQEISSIIRTELVPAAREFAKELGGGLKKLAELPGKIEASRQRGVKELSKIIRTPGGPIDLLGGMPFTIERMTQQFMDARLKELRKKPGFQQAKSEGQIIFPPRAGEPPRPVITKFGEAVGRAVSRSGQAIGAAGQGLAGGFSMFVERLGAGIQALRSIELPKRAERPFFESNRAVLAGTVEAARLQERARLQNAALNIDQQQLDGIRQMVQVLQGMAARLVGQPRAQDGARDIRENL